MVDDNSFIEIKNLVMTEFILSTTVTEASLEDEIVERLEQQQKSNKQPHWLQILCSKYYSVTQ